MQDCNIKKWKEWLNATLKAARSNVEEEITRKLNSQHEELPKVHKEAENDPKKVEEKNPAANLES